MNVLKCLEKDKFAQTTEILAFFEVKAGTFIISSIKNEWFHATMNKTSKNQHTTYTTYFFRIIKKELRVTFKFRTK